MNEIISKDGVAERSYWLQQLIAISTPVLEALAARKLRSTMPVEVSPNWQGDLEELREDRRSYTYLEAFSRLLCGIAPWLESASGLPTGEEEVQRARLAQLARAALDAGTDPASPDYFNFAEGYQPIVDTAFLALALLRAPRELWQQLEPRVQQNIVDALKLSRTRKPVFSNWLLFSAVTEAALRMAGESDWDAMRIDYALRQHEQWYLGDGIYGDGPELHNDYYNSFVIQPFLVELLALVEEEHREWKQMQESVLARSRRYAEVLERSIAPDGSFPPIGRSLAYRCGAFQTLAQSAWLGFVPDSLSPAQVRGALSSVIHKTLDAEGTFDKEGWLQIGLCGHQPHIAEHYISTGSLYLCTTAFLPLGLPQTHAFWHDPSVPWTSCSVWSGQSVGMDHALSGYHRNTFV